MPALSAYALVQGNMVMRCFLAAVGCVKPAAEIASLFGLVRYKDPAHLLTHLILRGLLSAYDTHLLDHLVLERGAVG